MVKLHAETPWSDDLPIREGKCQLDAVDLGPIWSIAPYRKAEKGVSAALSKALKLVLPAPGKSMSAGEATLLWSGREQYFLIGAHPPKLKAAVTDQSDAWCSVRLSGAAAIDVLARLCPLDLDALAKGDVARSLIGHMQAVIWRDGDAFNLMVFRGFARTLIHEMHGVMISLAAQDEIPQ